MSPLNITQPLGIWSFLWLLFWVMFNIPKMGQLPTPVLCWKICWHDFLGHFCGRWWDLSFWGWGWMGWKNFVPGLLKSKMEWHQQRTTNKELPLDLEVAKVPKMRNILMKSGKLKDPEMSFSSTWPRARAWYYQGTYNLFVDPSKRSTFGK